MVKRMVTPEIHSHYHAGKKFEVHVMLPKVRKENIELTFDKKGFCVRGSRPDVEFAACHSFPHPVDMNKVKTKYYNVEGLLEINVPLLHPIATKKITIK